MEATITDARTLKEESEKRITKFIMDELREFEQSTGLLGSDLSVSVRHFYVADSRKPFETFLDVKIETKI